MKKLKTGFFILLFCGLALLICQLYGYYHPDLRLSIVSSEDADNFSMPVVIVMVKEKILFGISSKIKNKLDNFVSVNKDFQERIKNTYDKPIQLVATTRYENGKTIVTYSGTVFEKSSQKIITIERMFAKA